jgi:cation:H+ antiporter
MITLFINNIDFAACTVVIIYSGAKLSFYGDKIAELTGWGKARVGLILMASVASLPELITGISSVAIIKAPDLAAGDIFGSCVFNMFILGFDDVFYREGSLFNDISSSRLLSVFITIIMTSVVRLGLLFKPKKNKFGISASILLLSFFYTSHLSYTYS